MSTTIIIIREAGLSNAQIVHTVLKRQKKNLKNGSINNMEAAYMEAAYMEV